MGQLVFQATLGGQVNLVGPNTASTFNLNVPAVSSTIATLTGTETFTNKTLTSPTITGGALNGTLGATTPSTVAATTISASGTTTLSGNQIISVTDNTNAALRITQLGTGNALLVEDSTNPDSTPVVIDANGAVIVGYTAAVGTQNYGGLALGNTLYQQHGTAQTTTTAAIFNWSSSAASPPNLIFNKSISNVVGTRGALTATNTDLGSVTFNGDDGTNFIPAAVILGETDGTPGTNDMPGRLVFSTTADGASAPTERMRIDSSGRVLVGLTSANTSGANFQVSSGVTFPATQSASSDANTLDDYEEGTWTPNQGGGLTVVGSFSSSGRYTKIGNMVFLQGYVSGSTSVALSNGNAISSNMPFTSTSTGSLVGIGGLVNASGTVGGTTDCGPNSTQLSGTPAIAATGTIYFSLTYQTT
jgi:hypothetical protein